MGAQQRPADDFMTYQRDLMATKANTPPYTGAPHYSLPESTLAELGRVRDELDRLAELTLLIGGHDESLHMSSLAFSQYFAQMSEGIAEALDACRASSDHAHPISRSRH
jgi:hypothetical protein